jgi:sec-independent protein translocase protein TatA
MGLSPLEIAVVGLLAVLLFGTKRIPELGTGLGKAISNFKNSYRDASTLDAADRKEVEAAPKESKTEAVVTEQGENAEARKD